MFIDVPILSHCSCSVMLDPSQSLAHKKCFCQYDMSFMTTLLMITCMEEPISVRVFTQKASNFELKEEMYLWPDRR